MYYHVEHTKRVQPLEIFTRATWRIGNSLNHIILSVKESGLNYSIEENLLALKLN